MKSRILTYAQDAHATRIPGSTTPLPLPPAPEGSSCTFTLYPSTADPDPTATSHPDATMKPTPSHSPQPLTPANQSTQIGNRAISFQRWLALLLICLGAALPLRALPVMDNNAGKFFDGYGDNGGILPPNNVTIATAGTVSLLPTKTSGSFTTVDIVPTSFDQWIDLEVLGTYAAVGHLQVDVFDDTGNHLLGPLPVNGSPISLSALNPAVVTGIKVRVSFTKPGSIGPTVNSLQVRWQAVSQLLLDKQGPATVNAGDNIVYSIRYSVNFVEAHNLVVWDTLPSFANGTLTYPTGPYSGQNDNPLFVSANKGGQYNPGPGSISVSGVTIPANTVYWVLGLVPEGTTDLLNITVATRNGTLNGTILENHANLDADNSPPRQSGPVTTVIGSAPSPFIDKQHGAAIFNVNGSLQTVEGTVNGFSIRVENRSGHGRETMYDTVVYDKLTDLVNVVEDLGTPGLADDFFNISPAGGVLDPAYDPDGAGGLPPFPAIVWQAGDLGPGATFFGSFNAKLKVNPPQTQYDNYACVISDQTSPVCDQIHVRIGLDETPSGYFAKGDNASGTFRINAATDDNPTFAVPYGGTVAFALLGVNNSMVKLNDVVFFDMVPPNTKFRSAWFNDPNLALSGARIFYSTATGFSNPNSPPPIDYTQAPADLDVLLNAYWELTPPTNPADVTWVAYYIPQLDSVHLPNLGTPALAGTPITSAIGYFDVDVFNPANQCTDTSLLNDGIFQVYERTALNGTQTPISSGPLTATDREEVIAKGYKGRLFIAGTPRISPDPTELPSLTTTYTATLRNSSEPTSDALANVTVTLQLSKVSINGVMQWPSVQNILPAGTFNSINGQVTILIGQMPVGGSQAIQLQLGFAAGILDQTEFTVAMSGIGSDDQCGTTTVSDTTRGRIRSSPKLRVSTSTDADRILSGDEYQYKLDYMNSGTGPSTRTWVLNHVPARTVFVRAYGNPNITAVYFSIAPNLPPSALTPLLPLTANDLPPSPSSFVLGVPQLDGSWLPPLGVSASDVLWIAWDVDDLALSPPQLLINAPRQVRFDVRNDHNGPAAGTTGSPDGTLLFNTAGILSGELQQAIGNQTITRIDNDPSILVKKYGPTQVEAGEEFDWVITYLNNTLHNDDDTAIIEDVLPSGVVLIPPSLVPPYPVTHLWNTVAVNHGAPGGNTPQQVSFGTINQLDGSTKLTFQIAGPGGYRALSPLKGQEGGTITLRVRALAGTPSGSLRRNDVCGTATREGRTYTSCATHEVTVFRPDLHLLKMANATEVLSGEKITYTLTLANRGPIAARGIEIRDVLPAGLSYVPGSLTVLPATCSLRPPAIVGQQLIWNPTRGNALAVSGQPAGQMPPNFGNILIQFEARVATSVPPCTTLDNMAEVKSLSTEEGVYPNIASASVKTPAPELSVAMSGVPLSIPGSRFTWNYNWVNQSKQSASGVYLIATLPNTDADADADVTFANVALPGVVTAFYHAGPLTTVFAFDPANPLDLLNGWTATRGAKVNRLAFLVGAMAGNSPSLTAQISVDLIDPQGSGGTRELPQAGACFTGSVIINQDVPLCENTANNSATARVCTPSLDLALTKTGSMEGNTPGITPGQPVTYTLAFQNNGTVNAYGVSVTDNLPATLVPGSPLDDFTTVNLVDALGNAVSPVDLSGNPISGTVPVTRVISDSTVTWHLGTTTPSDALYYHKVGLRPGHRGSFHLNVKVDGNVVDSTEICNSASISAAVGTEELLGNNSDDSCVLVRRPDLFVDKTGTSASGSPEFAEFGEEITYTIKYANTGDIDAQDVKIHEIVPDGTKLVSVNAPYDAVVTYLPNQASATSFTVKFQTLPANQFSIGPSESPGQTGTNARPSLRIQRSGNNAIITWPLSAEGYVLETTQSLNEPIIWQPESTPVTVFTNGFQGITVPMTNMASYYRLRHAVRWTDITFKVRVDSDPCGEPAPIENVVSITSTTPEKRTDNNTDSHTMFVRLTDLQVQCDTSAAAILENEILTHTINWLVDGPHTAPGAVLLIALPDGDGDGAADVDVNTVPTVAGVDVYFNTASALTPPAFDAQSPTANGWTLWTGPTAGVNHLAFHLGDRAIGSGGTLTYTTRIKVGASGLNLCFGVSGITARRDLNCDNNLSSCCVIVGHWPNVYVRKSAPGCVHPGELVTFQITYGNNGNGPAANVVVADILPPELTFVSAVPAPTGAGPTWNNLGATPGTLAPGESSVITVVAQLANDCTLVGRKPVNAANITTTSEQANVADDFARATLDCIVLDFVSVSGFVYHDRDADCQRGAGEAGIPGVTITLTGIVPCGSPVTLTTVTDQNGEYSFTGLYPGDYILTETQPANWVTVGDALGTLGGINTSPVDNVLGAITLLGGQYGLEYNFCEAEPSRCAQITSEELKCSTDESSDLTYTFTVQNRTPDPVKFLTFTSLSDCMESEIVALPTALASGASVRVSVDLLASADCGADLCFWVGLHNARLQECCAIERCLPNPLVPTLVCPPDLIVECQNPTGTPVQFPPITASVCSSDVAVVCTPASGSSFLPGITTVTCRTAGSPDCTFTVTVVDRTPPAISCPQNIVVNCASANGSEVTFAVNATDSCDSSVNVRCSRTSGSLFAPGTTPVVCTATDDSGNTSTCSFTVTVNVDAASPTIAGCANITVNATAKQTATVVHYNVTATDDSAGTVALVCTPPSGHAFPCGTSTVSCRATDPCGKTALCSFAVTVNCGKGDLMVEDTPHNYTGAPDLGREPDSNMNGKNMWLSRAIWIRNACTGGTGTYLDHENPRFGQENCVLVNVKNRGTAPVADAKLEVYYANASMGLTWPDDWTPVGTYDLPGINGGDSFIANLPWSPPDTGHYCLIARIVSVSDPMAVVEDWIVGDNARANNNIAWRNMNVTDCVRVPAKKVEVRARNTGRRNQGGGGLLMAASAGITATNPVTFEFTASDDFITTGGEAILDLGPLFTRWQGAGANGTNVVATNGTQVRFTGSPAYLRDIPMGEREVVVLNFTMAAAEVMPGDGTNHVYDLALNQLVDEERIGGVSYALIAPTATTDLDGDGLGNAIDTDDDGDGIPDDVDDSPRGGFDCEPVRLNIARTAGGVVLNWTGLGYRLQTTTALGQPWTDVPGATSPAQLPATAPQQYFKLVCRDNQSCSIGVVGYVNTTLQSDPSGSATNLIANPLNGTNNHLNTILPLPDDYAGTTVLRWNSATQNYYEPIVFLPELGWVSSDGGAQSVNPGEGFWIMPAGSNALTVTFVGEVPQGSFTNALPAGWSLRSSIVPQAGSLTSLGFPAGEEDVVITFDSTTQQLRESYIYLTGIGWLAASTGEPLPDGPVLAPSEAFMVYKMSPALWVRNFRLECVSCTGLQITADPQSQTVVQNTCVTFNVGAASAVPVSYQWYRNGQAIPGATGASFTQCSVGLADNGARYFVTVTNACGSASTRDAILTVAPDTTPPTLVSASANCESNTLTVTFSEPLEPGSAVDMFAYTLSDGVTVNGATLLSDGRTVELATSPLAAGITYTLTVNDVRDLFINVILPDTQRSVTCPTPAGP